MPDPSIWYKIDEIERDLKQVKLCCALFFLAFVAVGTWAVVVYCQMQDIMVMLK
jgi:hypothetical protein